MAAVHFCTSCLDKAPTMSSTETASTVSTPETIILQRQYQLLLRQQQNCLAWWLSAQSVQKQRRIQVRRRVLLSLSWHI